MGVCGACVVLAVLASRGIAGIPQERGIDVPFTPRPATAQLDPPTALPESTTASSSDPTHEDGAAGLLHILTTQVRLFLACVPRWGPVACLKLEALLVLHGEAGDGVEGFGPDSESRHGAFFAELSEQPEARDAYLNKLLIRALEELLEDALGLSRQQKERGMRRRRRWPNPMIAVLFGLGSLILVGGIAKTALIAGKALALSLLALAMAVMMGLRGGGGGGGGGAANYEILAGGLRRRVGVSTQYPATAMYLDSSSEQPSGLGGQSMAYNGHVTRP